MMNRIVLVGRLTKDPELRYTPNGVPVATFTLAVNRNFKNAQGEQEADFINCVVWRKPAENVANYLKKGSLAGVDGRLQTRNYDGQDGKRVYVTEVMAESVQFLEPRSSSQNGSNSSGSGTSNSQGSQNNRSQNNGYSGGNSNNSNYNRQDDPFSNNSQTIDISDDDLPF